MSQKTKAAEFANAAWDVSVCGRNVLVTDAMKSYAIDKISKIERFTNRIIDASVTMDIQKLEHRVDIILKVENIKIKSSAATNDMYISIDQAVDKIEKQIRRHKSRIQEHHNKGIKSVDMRVNVFQAPLYDPTNEVNSEIEEENLRKLEEEYRPHTIVAEETMPLEFLSNEDAIRRMELSGDEFLFFIEEGDRNIKAIYRRQDGNYGIVEPKI